MAAADYLDDDEFDEYNPHPYGGGYDISATYGSPLPPSPATCYPVASPAAVPAPTAPQPRPPLPQPPAPAPASPPAPPAAEPHYYDYGDAPPYQPMYATPEVFRAWPFLPGAHCRHSAACAPRDYWRQCMRGLDYLFGHSDGYGERHIGVDCLGVPVYANTKGAVQDAVVVEVAPPDTGTVRWHEHDAAPAEEHDCHSNRLSWYANAEDEAHTYAQPTYTWYSYDPSYEQPYDSHGVSDETTWFPNQSYQQEEVYNYKEEESQYQEFLSCNQDSPISSQPIFSYNQHFGEQPLHVHVEPPETVSSHKLEYYENFSTYDYQNDVNILETSRQSYEIQPYVHMTYDQVEPYKPSWSLNSCTEGITPEYDNHTLASGECWDMSSLFMSPFYPQETQTYEQPHGDWNV
ncbi:hypothetical protein BS78_02G393200 [Paspalum vaginatum]|nr:hypothetical protein BS78_02G393200 [Paspalum vaginatum]